MNDSLELIFIKMYEIPVKLQRNLSRELGRNRFAAFLKRSFVVDTFYLNSILKTLCH